MTIRVNRFEISFGSSMINVSKTENSKNFSETQFMVHPTE